MKWIWALARGCLSLSFLMLNTGFWCVGIYSLVILRFIFPIAAVKDRLHQAMVWIAESWISCNSWILDTFYRIEWRVQGTESLRMDRSYLVCVNHQSWTDIVVLQKVFNRKIPFMRFFIKRELIYMPLLGLAWKALDFPMMKRHSKKTLEKHPEKRGEDLATTRRFCERLRGRRLSILNFLEGTRFTLAKYAQQKPPYRHLLKPKAGGLAFVLEAMGGQFHSLLDVTIFYPNGRVNIWGLLTGAMSAVDVIVREVTIPAEILRGGYLVDGTQRERVQAWVHELWLAKDAKLEELSRISAAK